MRTALIALAAAVAAVSACDTSASPPMSMSPPMSPPMSKDEARAAAAKTDGPDYCEVFSWYGDGECDGFCARPDPDCGGVLDEFRVSVAGACPAEVDCTSFISIDGSGALRVDYFDDVGGAVREAVVPADVMAAVLPVVTDAALVATLASSELPCPVPQDFAEVMQLSLDGAVIGNITTLCPQPELASARNLMHQLVAIYVPRFAGFAFEAFALCAPPADCYGRIELFADGTVVVDRFDEPAGAVHKSQLPASRFIDAIRVLTDADFVDLMQQDKPPCPATTDYFESMELHTAGVTLRQPTGLCDAPELERVRALLAELAAHE